ncbi:hypothetical protein ZOSMA_45G00520 [Zostera marina]|uniref:Uncharacterized protein n=1 Tax=Zostera marina TaxID=29655 RepID=A0A0K9P2S3_ZOSMR|nr:hypothetical protein ZOSMA_45G00520 [Zostera marina]
MKASLKFCDDEHGPVEGRCKVPITVFGFPFSTGVSAGGDPKSVRFDLSTSFDSFPSVRASYRPNDSFKPFSLVVKSGVGALGSPISAPMSMSAEFNLLHRGHCPAFFLHIKPSFGDFSVIKTTTSFIPSPASSHASGIIGSNDEVENGRSKFNEIPPMRGIDGILSGIDVMVRSVLPIKNKANVKFRWGLRIPTEFHNSYLFGNDETEVGGVGRKQKKPWISPRDLPMLLIRKVSIEYTSQNALLAQEKETGKNQKQKELEVLRAEQETMKRTVDDFRADLDKWKKGGHAMPLEVKGRGGEDGSKSGKIGRRSTTPPAKEDINEELKKALATAAASGGN